jgi:hypothetical protein
MLLASLSLLCTALSAASAAGGAGAGAGAGAAQPDLPYYQDISHRSLFPAAAPLAAWATLPFAAADSVLHLGGARDCFVSLSQKDNMLYSSSHNDNKNKLMLESPYNTWGEYFALPAEIQGLELVAAPQSGDKKAGSRYEFFVVSADSVYGARLGEAGDNTSAPSPCGQVDSLEQLVSPVEGGWGRVLATAASPSALWVSSSGHGLSRVSVSGGVEAVAGVCGAVSLLWVQAWRQLFAGCAERLDMYTYEGDAVVSRQHEWVGGVIDTTPLGFAYDAVNDAVWVAETHTVHKLSADGRWWRYGQKQGAPLDNVTSVAAVGGFVYVGAETGLARVRGDADPSASSSPHHANADPWQWQYYGGHRYLPDDAVSTLVPNGNANTNANSPGIAQTGIGGDGSVVVACVTATGIALMQAELWTLSEKALSMQQFQEPRHDRRGLVADCQLQEYGDVSSYAKQVKDNDGLWTCMHGMGEAYRYMATSEPTARQAAWRAFEAAELLSILPGASYPSYPARSYCVPADGDIGCGTAGGQERWHASSVQGYEEYLWKDDTSSDEIDGHLAFYPLVYDHIAKTPEERDRVYKLIDGITGGILENNYYLIDPITQQPTTWGIWGPEQLNDNPEHYSERGVNSVEILGYLASAYSITQDVKYKDAFWDLALNYGYIYNANNAKVDNPQEDNHSDNELIYMGYHVLLYSLQRLKGEGGTGQGGGALVADVQAMVDALVPSLERSWSIVRGERSPLWLGIYAGMGAGLARLCPSSYSDAVWSLRRWAVDLVSWPVVNSERFDLNLSPFSARDSTNAESQEIISPQERATGHWNGDPFQLDGGSGTSESEPSVWRLPYYLMRYNNLIGE